MGRMKGNFEIIVVIFGILSYGFIFLYSFSVFRNFSNPNSIMFFILGIISFIILFNYFKFLKEYLL